LLRKTVSGIMLTLLFIGMLTLAFNIQPAKAEPTTIIVPDDYPTIQEAINNANEGDTVLVRSGVYCENLVIDKSVLVIGENRVSTIIQSRSTDGDVFLVDASDVMIANLTITLGLAGVYLSSYAQRVTVHSNIIIRNGLGIYSAGENCNFSLNQIIRNKVGIAFSRSSNNTVSNNFVGENEWIGISFEDYSEKNLVISNIIKENGYNPFDEFCAGIFFCESSNNTIFYNDIINNKVQVYDWQWTHVGYNESINTWDNGYPSGGNYWSDYVGVDYFSGPYQNETGSDGIGDTPYNIDKNDVDHYPLMESKISLDLTPPSIGTPYQNPLEFEVMDYVEVLVSVGVTDDLSGVKNVFLSYSTGNGTWNYLLMEYNATSGLYQSIIPGQPYRTRVKYKIIALDNAGNLAVNDNNGMYFSYLVGMPYFALATVDIYPQALNLISKGQWVIIYIELGNVTEYIEVSTLMLNNTVPADLTISSELGDHDNDGLIDLMVRFNRTAIVEFIMFQGLTFGNLTLTLFGKLGGFLSGLGFRGSVVINVSSLPGDVNCDGIVDICDITQAAASYNFKEGEPNWNPNANYAPPYDRIEICDIVTIAYHYGETYP